MPELTWENYNLNARLMRAKRYISALRLIFSFRKTEERHRHDRRVPRRPADIALRIFCFEANLFKLPYRLLRNFLLFLL